MCGMVIMDENELEIRREIVKRMLNRGMEYNYISKISGLKVRDIEKIDKIRKSQIGVYDLRLRKQIVSIKHRKKRFYRSDKSLFETGVEIDKLDFYQNKLNKSEDIITNSINYGREDLRMKSLTRYCKYLEVDEEIFEDFLQPVKDAYIYEGVPTYVTYLLNRKGENIEKEELAFKLLEKESNLKKIAFICDLNDEKVEDIVCKNSMFMTDGKLDRYKFKKEMDKWERETRREIAKRLGYYVEYGEEYSQITGLPKNEVEELFTLVNSMEETIEKKVRGDVVKKLIEDSNESLQVISEISGMIINQVEMYWNDIYFNEYLRKSYDKTEFEELKI